LARLTPTPPKFGLARFLLKIQGKAAGLKSLGLHKQLEAVSIKVSDLAFERFVFFVAQHIYI
jgi:hypothetical protein